MFKEIRNCIAILIGAALIASGFNLFLVPHHLLSGGVSGLAMLTGYFSPLSIKTMYLVYNAPILIAGWFLLGKRFVGLSILSVIGVTCFMALIPEKPLASDTLLSAVFGGVLVGMGSGFSFRVGGSSGGFDIIGSIVTRYRDFPIGNILVGMNGLVILAMGYLEGNWNLALASMVSIYLAGKILDFIHINHLKVTLFIITDRTDELLERLLCRPRGVTLIKTQGAFSHKEKDMLMTVTTRYELTELKEIIKSTDPAAFVNIVETVGVMGSFRRR
ncbi:MULTISPECIES: YitT family protein [Paenibacillus]|uniref:Membrane protein n=1 Tax=Paenibacillus vini TaxID=1476024 RepID=A0ABQ4MBZ7_9BACL|nr:YitT family protein [Paenibacillus vini]MBQ4898638.1 YitT family protein [Paenibacillus sp. Marseille-P2973]MDN4069428.1 YitT family protein [Paenibacillus vini]GIP53157.1 membrane protein [Paenibacillus vini]